MMISNKARNIGESPTLAIDAKYKQLLSDGEDVISFGAGEPDFDTPDNIKQAAIDAINAGYTKYTPAAGALELRSAVCEKLERDNNLIYRPNQIVVSNGAKHSLVNAFMAILNEGEEVVIPIPYWVSYPEMVKIAGSVPKVLKTSEEDGYKITPKKLTEAITPKTKAIVINSPSNPLGIVYSTEELQAIADIAVEKNIYVISDEIYEKIMFGGVKHVSIASLSDKIKDLTIVVNGTSKSYSMTGWRIGYTASNAEVAKVMANIQSHATSNPCSISQKAALEAVSGPQASVEIMRSAFEERRKFIIDYLDKIDNISYIRPQGAFYIMLNVTKIQKAGESTNDFCARLLDEAKIALVPGDSFGMDGFVRMSFATSLENLKKGLDRLAECAKNR